jgi:LysM domain-containing protein
MILLRRAIRLSIVTAVVAIAVAVVWLLTADPTLELVRSFAGPGSLNQTWTVDRLVADLGAALLLVASAGLAAMIALAVTATLAADRAPLLAARCRRLTPSGCRRLVTLLLGVGLAAPATAGGWATAAEHHPPCLVRCQAQPPALGGLRLPDLPITPAPAPQRTSAAGPHRVIVQRGDSLWHIAERHCGAAASVAQVAAFTDRLYALNRATVGDDPDLIFPGMTLLIPEGRP